MLSHINKKVLSLVSIFALSALIIPTSLAVTAGSTVSCPSGGANSANDSMDTAFVVTTGTYTKTDEMCVEYLDGGYSNSLDDFYLVPDVAPGTRVTFQIDYVDPDITYELFYGNTDTASDETSLLTQTSGRPLQTIGENNTISLDYTVQEFQLNWGKPNGTIDYLLKMKIEGTSTGAYTINITRSDAGGGDTSNNDDTDWFDDVSYLATPAFSDVAKDDEYYVAVQYLKENGVVEGYSDGEAKLSNKINRAEIAKIMVEGALGETPDESTYSGCFPDFVGSWFDKYVCRMQELEIVGGYPDGEYKAANNMNGAEAIKILTNTFEFAEGLDGNTSSPFTDVSESDWYAKYVLAALDRGLLSQTSGTLGVANEITRGEVFEMLYRAMVVEDKSLDSFDKDEESSYL